MKKFYLNFLFILLTVSSIAQNIGDFQSASSGDWTSVNSWSEWDGSNWVNPASVYPGQNLGTYTVLIQAGNTITIATNLATASMGNVTVNGILSLNPNPAPNEITLNTPSLEINGAGALLNFAANKVKLTLPSGSSLSLQNGGDFSGSCTANDEIYIGLNKYAACRGGGPNTYTFGDVAAAGGTINAEIVTPSSLSISEEVCTLLNIEGGYIGTGTNVNYNWVLRDPNGNIVPTSLDSGILTSALPGDSGVSTFTPSILGDYLLTLEVTEGTFTNVETRIITVTADVTPPVLVGVPADTTVQCDAIPGPPAVTATDNCDTTLTVNYSETANTVSDGVGSITRQWTVTDNGGNTTTETQTITVIDSTAPALVGVPADATVQCDAIPGPPAVTATDNCDTTLTVNYSETANTVSDGVGSITRQWTVTDDGGNTTTETQTITVIDSTAPALVGVPADATVQCDAIPGPPAVTATDNCDTTLTVNYSETANTVSDGVGSITRQWTVTDNGGNTTTETQTITVIDSTAPALVGVPADATVQCDAIPGPPAVTATDNCDTTLTVNYSETANTVSDGVGSITRQWTVTDDGGNTTTETQTITVIDSTAPALVGVPADATVQCDAIPGPPAVTATDNCDTTLTVNYSETANTVSDGVGSITRQWTVTDDGGNTTTETQTITVIDSTAPALVGVPADATVQCDAIPGPPAVTATDNCDTTLTVNYSETANTVSDGVGSITRQWTVTDNGGNTTTETQTITVIDSTAPALVGVPADATVQCDAIPGPPAVTATDNCDTTLTVNYSETANTVSDGVGSITRQWTVTDDGGNTTTETQTITVIDSTAPALVGVPADATVQCDAIPGPPAVTATDNCDTTLTVNYSETANTVSDGVGSITRQWTVTDDGGNTTTETQTITVIDSTAPALVGVPADATVQCDAIPGPPAVTATDNCDTTLTVNYSETANTVSDGVGSITRQWTVTDNGGNTTTETQTITVIDSTAPALVGVPADATVQCDAIPGPPAVTATDNCDTTLTVNYSETANTVSDGVGSITRQWTVTDDGGNTTTETQTITVIDSTAPALVGVPADATVQCDAIPGPPAVTATDNCDTTLTVNYSETANTVSDGVGSITRQWTVTDNGGNTTTETQTITVIDSTAPALVGVPADATVQCDAIPGPPAVTATDNCDTTLTVNYSETANTVSDGVGSITRQWTVTDNGGNTTTETQTITVIDSTAPALVGVPADATVQCDAIPGPPAVTATDNCDTTLTVNYSETANTVSDGVGSITRQWTVTDNGGNTTTETQTITVIDSTAPIITCPANITTTTSNDGTGNCTTTVALGNPTVSDNCTATGSLIITNNAPATFPVGTTTVTWTVTDAAGNQNTCTQNVTVTDNENPTITCPTNITVSANASCMAIGVALGTPTTADNCGIASVTNDAPSSFPLGDTVVTWTITDNAGLTATCTQTVTVNDTTPPTITCPGDQNVNFDANCEFSLQDYTALANTSDNCDSNLTITQSPAPGALIAGTVTVTLTATDDANNSSTCTFDVIPADTINPIAVAQDITVYLAPNGTVNIAALDLENGSTDNCVIVTRTVTPSSFNCGDVGINPVTYTVYDNAGNSHSTTANVTIVDNTPPTMLCNDFVVVVDAITRVATIQATDVDNGSNDACGLATLTVSPDTFAEQSAVYTTTATLTATDVNGNTNTCIVNVTVEPPKNQFTYLTGVIVNPIPDNPRPPSALIEVTACPDDLTVPRDVEFTLQAIGTYNLQPSDVNFWEYSTDNGETWTQIAGTSGILTYTLTGITSDTFVRLNITDNSDPLNPIVKTSAEAYVRFLPPDEPPVVVSQSAVDICLGDSVTIVAESFFDQPNGQFGEGGEFNYAQPDGWRVNYLDGYFPASGDNGNETSWKETNSNNNATFSGINYDTTDNTKFAIAHGVGNVTQLETPVFSTIGMTSAEAILNFNTSYYFCNGGYGTIWLSFDSGNTYTVDLTSLAINQNSNSPLNLTSGNTTGVELVRNNGNCNNGQRPTTNPRMVPSTINLGQWVGLSGLRIRFEFFGSTTECQNVTFPKASGNTCTNNPTYNVASGWAIDAVGFAYAYVEDELEWTDEDGTVIAIGTTATVTPVTPGQREYGVTALVNGCRADNDDGTNFININTSLAYAGQDYTPLASQCGESALQLNAYDNTKTAVTNYNKGAWENNLYVVPNVSAGDTDYAPTGVTGQWSIVSSTNTSCGTVATFSSNTDPDAIFTANPGTYVLRWTLQDGSGCSDDVTVTITSCTTIDFDGVNDNITFRNNYNFNGTFSLETWVKPNSTNGTRTVLSKKDAADNTKGYALNIVGGQVVFNWHNNSGTGSVTSGANTIGTDRWYHLAVTFDGSQYILYVDGIQLGSANGSAPSQTAANVEAILGAMDQLPSNNSPTNYFHGWIDEVRIWNSALSIEHIRQMMNQRIEASGTDVIGAVIPTRINGKDANVDGLEDTALTWNNLVGYYRMNVSCGDLAPYKGVSGRLRNITTSQQKTAPLPYTSRANGTWTVDNTWTNFPVWDTPNSNGINGTPIDWNIVRTAHNITSGDKDITVLGLLVDNNELSIEDPSTPLNENNDGQMLWVTKYLKIDGKLDLVGDSQLVQKRYNPNQFGGSVFDNTSTGYAERDQQGQVNPFNYNYFSPPFAPNNATVNNENTSNTFTIGGVLRDGTTTVANPINRNIVWTANNTAAGGNPTQVSTRWLYAYNDNAGNTYSEWEYLNTSGSLNIGLGYTMKGSGNATAEQNYVFVGKPNNGTISNTVSPESGGLANDILLGNPYPSALDANEFIKDNIPLLNPDNSPSQANGDTTQSINGTLYFWEHYAANNTHILRDYQGGYATYNLSGGLQATTPPPTEDGIIIVGGSGTVIPKRYVPVAQGFFVTGSPGGGLIKFHNDQRAFVREASSSSVFFAPNNSVQETEINTSSENLIKRLRLSFKSSEGAERQLLLAFTPNDEADDNYNYGYDAPNYDTFPSDLSWSINNERYVIQGVGQFDNSKKYPFIMEVGKSGEIEISLDDLENFDSAIDVYIYDALLGTYTKFNDTPFKATLSINDYTERFFLAFINEESLSTPKNEIDSIRLYYLNDTKEIYINWVNSYDIKEIKLINILGQTVKTYTDIEPINSHEIRVPVKNISEGNYVIKVTNSHGKTTNKKVVIKQ